MDNIVQQYNMSYINDLIDTKIKSLNTEIEKSNFSVDINRNLSEIKSLKLFRDFINSSDSIVVNLDFATYKRLIY
jgi:hypothetical protein